MIMTTFQDTENEALGTGLEFPIRVNRRGAWGLVRHEDKVRQSIWAILSTAKGERVMRPDFGCDLQSFVFATMDAATLTMIKASIRDALVRWEPRIDVREVTVEREHGGQAGETRLLINVSYMIRLTNFATNLVYPFYLQTGLE